MSYDTQVPFNLKAKQQWFASIITRPIDDHSRMIPTAPSGSSMEQEAAKYILPSPTLEPHQRIELYNQQYWWRFLSTLHDAFPLVVRMFGYHDFNKIFAMPYTLKYPSNHWSLNVLGNRLPQWVREEYHEPDKQLVQDAIDIDWAFSSCFSTAHHPSIDAGALKGEDLLSQMLYLQPHVRLFKLDYNLFRTRREFLEHDVEYWLENDFPKLNDDKTYHFILYRDFENNIAWQEIAPGEHALLTLFEHGTTIEKACDWLEGSSLYDEAAENLQAWFHKWTARQWLTPKKR